MKLEDWLDATRTRRNEFAGLIGVTPQTVTGYCDGSITPSLKRARKIEEVTRGEVTAQDFPIRDGAAA